MARIKNNFRHALIMIFVNHCLCGLSELLSFLKQLNDNDNNDYT